jgi:calcium-dependent protein kinase
MGVIIFIMVTGTPPFNGQDDRAIMKAVSKGEYHWPRNLKVSESLKDLVAKLLVMQPEKRLTALQALEHPWLKGERKVNIIYFFHF